MSSSISNSDAEPGWGRCLLSCFGLVAAGGLLILVLAVLVDPYDSGHFGWLGLRGIADRYASTANASRARDPQFDSAIFGNSTGQLLEPDRLDGLTGRRFVQLVAPGADPRGDLAILGFFARHHPAIGALVFVTDDLWCKTELPPLAQDAFPFWLYQDNAARYLANLFNWRAIDRAIRRIAIARGSRAPTRADGYWNYEEVWPPGAKHPQAAEPAKVAPFSGRTGETFPFAAMLADAVASLPRDVPIVIVMPPTFYTAVPQPYGRAAASHRDCKAAYQAIVRGRANSSLIDYRVDNALTRDPANFVDLIHYRPKIARKLEDGIAASLRDGEKAKLDF